MRRGIMGQFPFQRQHDYQDRHPLDQVGDNVDNRMADGILRTNDIIIKPAH